MGFDAVVDGAKLNGALTATAEAIRNKTDSIEPITFDMNEGFKFAVDGIEIGGDTETAYNEGFDAGKKAEYDEFWDTYQNQGKIKNYSMAFAFGRFDNLNFKPKYDIIPIGTYGADQMFYNSYTSIDIVAGLAYNDVKIDFTQTTRLRSTFDRCNVVSIPIIDAKNISSMDMTFYDCNNDTGRLDIYIMNLRSDCVFNRAFEFLRVLKTLMITGTIGQNGFNVSWSPLDKASLTSIVNALSPTTTGLTVTLSLDAVKKAFETSEGAMDGLTSDEWLNLIATKSNWTISLI